MEVKECKAKDCKKAHYRKGKFCSDTCRKRQWERDHKRSQAGRVKKKKYKPSPAREINHAEIIRKYGVKHV